MFRGSKQTLSGCCFVGACFGFRFIMAFGFFLLPQPPFPRLPVPLPLSSPLELACIPLPHPSVSGLPALFAALLHLHTQPTRSRLPAVPILCRMHT